MERASGPEDAIRRWIVAVLSQASNARVADQTRAVMWNFQQLPKDMHGHSSRPPVANLLVEPLHRLGSPDPERDAAVIGDIAFGRLDHHLWGPKATAADVSHAVEFCLAAVERRSTS
jgi:hypothetical protein